jgi:hypothetical protein
VKPKKSILRKLIIFFLFFQIICFEFSYALSVLSQFNNWKELDETGKNAICRELTNSLGQSRTFWQFYLDNLYDEFNGEKKGILNLNIIDIAKSKINYLNALERYSDAASRYENMRLSKAYIFYDSAVQSARYAREKNALSKKEMEEMSSLVHQCREMLSKINDFKREFESLISNKQIARGMTKEDVRKSWGNPASKDRISNEIEIWYYENSKTVYFEEGDVERWVYY